MILVIIPLSPDYRNYANYSQNDLKADQYPKRKLTKQNQRVFRYNKHLLAMKRHLAQQNTPQSLTRFERMNRTKKQKDQCGFYDEQHNFHVLSHECAGSSRALSLDICCYLHKRPFRCHHFPTRYLC